MGKMDFDGEDVPLVAVAQEHQVALAREEMSLVLASLGLCAPSQGEQYWRIPGDLRVDQLKARAKVLAAVGRGDGVANAILGVESSLLVVVRGLGAVAENRKVEKKKKKRGPNKWLPFRRPEEAMPPPPAKSPASEKKKSTKAKNKSFLDRSDEEQEENADNIDEPVEDVIEEEDNVNDENADPENKENVPAKKTPTPKKVMSKKSTIDKARLLKLLNDDSDLGSTDSDDEEVKNKKESDKSDEGVVNPLTDEAKPEKVKKARALRKQTLKLTRGKIMMKVKTITMLTVKKR